MCGENLEGIMARSKSSKKWLKRHFADNYVKKSWQEGYRSRSAYKLLELQDKYDFVKSNMVVLDLGAAPGGWSQVVSKLLDKKGRILALDLLSMEKISGVEFIHGDFYKEETLNNLFKILQEDKVNLILSDMAPNMTGIKAVDQARSMHLAEMVFEFAEKTLVPHGNMLVKIFQGVGFDQYLETLRASFKKVLICKPQSSRGGSRELYLLAKDFKKCR